MGSPLTSSPAVSNEVLLMMIVVVVIRIALLPYFAPFIAAPSPVRPKVHTTRKLLLDIFLKQRTNILAPVVSGVVSSILDRISLKKNLDASKPSEHSPNQREKMSKRLFR